MERRWFLRSLLVLLIGAMPAAALDVRIQCELLSLDADHAPLRDVLKEFVRAGVDVRIDPSIRASVTGRFRQLDMETALQQMLEPFGYALIWDVVDGPLGPLPKLKEMQIFKVGAKKNLQPFLKTSPNYEVATGPDTAGPPFVKDEILLAVKPGTSIDDFRRLLFQIGGTVIASIPELGIYHVRLPAGTNVPALVAQLQQNGMVHTVEPNYIVDAPPPVVSAAAGASVPTLISVATSSEGAAPMAILDSGLGSIEGLEQMIVGRLDAVNPDRKLTDPLGHGTQMALIAAGLIAPGGVPEGMDATGVPLVVIRAFDDNGKASNFGILRSIEYALKHGARPMNMSWGSETSSKFLKDAIAYAFSKDMIIVAAAGNEPTGRPYYPAAYPGVLGVSATNPDGSFWSRSNYGDFISLAAPGSASFPIGYNGPPGTYAGTSISSAYVARALARYFASHPTATAKEALAALKGSLTDAGAEGKDAQYGYGALDAAAMRRLLGLE